MHHLPTFPCGACTAQARNPILVANLELLSQRLMLRSHAYGKLWLVKPLCTVKDVPNLNPSSRQTTGLRSLCDNAYVCVYVYVYIYIHMI